jgi:hypothetical protein
MIHHDRRGSLVEITEIAFHQPQLNGMTEMDCLFDFVDFNHIVNDTKDVLVESIGQHRIVGPPPRIMEVLMLVVVVVVAMVLAMAVALTKTCSMCTTTPSFGDNLG